MAECKKCHYVRSRLWEKNNPERTKEIDRLGRERNRDRILEQQKRWRLDNPGLAARRMRDWRLKNLDRHNQNQRNRDKRIKDKVFNAYGGYICNCCGETEKLFLTIDHINNDGNVHRKQLFGKSRSGRKFYEILIRENFPIGYQVLCMNCNWGKSRNRGVCPHKLFEGSETILNGVGSSEPKHKAPQLEGEDIVQSTQQCVAAEMAAIV